MNNNTMPPLSMPGNGNGSVDSVAPRRNSSDPNIRSLRNKNFQLASQFSLLNGYVVFIVISAFLLVSIVFIPIGVAALFASRDVVEIGERYDVECIPASNRTNKVGYIQTPGKKTCNRTFRVPKHMKKPIYVYYQLDNFYQSHRSRFINEGST